VGPGGRRLLRFRWCGRLCRPRWWWWCRRPLRRRCDRRRCRWCRLPRGGGRAPVGGAGDGMEVDVVEVPAGDKTPTDRGRRAAPGPQGRTPPRKRAAQARRYSQRSAPRAKPRRRRSSGRERREGLNQRPANFSTRQLREDRGLLEAPRTHAQGEGVVSVRSHLPGQTLRPCRPGSTPVPASPKTGPTSGTYPVRFAPQVCPNLHLTQSGEA
jgi:hypothetical protein